MSATRRPMRAWFRPAIMAAALLALALQLMFPAGFMAAAPGQAHGLPIVICSAEGQTVVDWDLVAGHAVDTSHGKSKAPPSKSMPGCLFAGHALASPLPAPTALAIPAVFVLSVSAPKASAPSPGRGLAAPPPPPTGPPALI